MDVWSCGVILFALLCARLPFDDDYIPNLFKKIRSGVYNVPPHVSEECKELIASMLVVDPLKRSTIQEIRDHPWLQINLPPYLLKTMNIIHSLVIEDIDTRVLQELMMKCKISREAAIRELKSEEPNQYHVAYQLIYDNIGNEGGQ